MDQMPIQEVDVPQSLENTLAMVASRLGKVEVVRDYEPHLPCISAYGRELNQVWTALIENALDAVQDEGTIKLLVRTAGDMVLIEVWDNGPGIPQELQARIFEPFVRVDPAGSAGLQIVLLPGLLLRSVEAVSAGDQCVSLGAGDDEPDA